MSTQPAEVADVFRIHWQRYCQQHGASVTPLQHRVASAIKSCRTAALGGHLLQCNRCGHAEQSYNSCRNRHCPKCQGGAAQDWVTQRSDELLPVPYFHAVFTLPHELNELVLMNKKLIYELLFKAVSRTLLQIGRRNLKVQLGFFAILHTWGQTLTLHPHLHVVIPGVGISLDGVTAVKLKKQRYFVSDRILSAVFRGKFIQLLKKAFAAKKLRGEFDDFEAFLNRIVKTRWVVRTKPPFGGPQVALKYLARYTHRVAIGNSRIVDVNNGTVTFRYKDYKTLESDKRMTLSAVEFIRRFLLHLLPSGFVRVRYYGFLARQHKAAALALLRSAFHTFVIAKPASNPHRPSCPCCKIGELVEVGRIQRFPAPFEPNAPPFLRISTHLYF